MIGDGDVFKSADWAREGLAKKAAEKAVRFVISEEALDALLNDNAFMADLAKPGGVMVRVPQMAIVDNSLWQMPVGALEQLRDAMVKGLRFPTDDEFANEISGVSVYRQLRDKP